MRVNQVTKKTAAIIFIIISLLFTFPISQASAGTKPMRLDVPNYRQIWEPWVYQTVGYGNSNFEMGGCAITSLAMVFKYFGVDTDPGRLNEWLKSNGGFLGGAISWSKAAEIGNGIWCEGIKNYDGNADLDYIRSLIDSGFPVIARMGYKGTSHYVVICGYEGDTFYLNDPWYENPGHTINSVVKQGNLDVCYDDCQDPAVAIKDIVVFKSSNPTSEKVPVVEVKSIFSQIPDRIVHPLSAPSLEMKIEDPYMYVAGVKKIVDPVQGAAPKIVDGRTLVPIRSIIEEMGGEITWDSENRKVLINVQDRTLEMWVGVRTAFNNMYFFEFDVAPQIIDGRTYIPLRIVAEQLGAKVTWQPDSQSILIASR